MSFTRQSPDPNIDLRWRVRDWIGAVALFAITAAVVLWQNARVTVLWDVSYILENATRISQGQLPYRDFPFPYAPLTFLSQAAIIRLFGRVYWHHVLYAATLGGVATVLTWRIVLRLLNGRVQYAWATASLLAAPCCVLGIYCVFPHPFYDPDCTFAVLAGLLALLRIEDRIASSRAAMIGAGALLVVPIFIKQNIGLIFTSAILLSVLIEAALSYKRGERECVRRNGWIALGAVMAAVIAVALVAVTVGLGSYILWTVKFAASRRLPAWREMLGVYTNPALGFWLVCMLAGAVIAVRVPRSWARWIPALLLATPFLWAVTYLALDPDVSERAERLLAVWPPVMVACFVLAVLQWRSRRGIRRWLPFVLLATVHAAFLSQQLWGSTYALWPLLMVLIACALGAVRTERTTTPLKQKKVEWDILLFAALIASAMLISGTFYIRSEERLSYVNAEEGKLTYSSLPALRGMAMRGPWLLNFEELVRYTDREIPRDEGVLMLPGEDLFYFATGRTPQFPAVMFDHTVNPYDSPEDLVAAVRARSNIRWMIVKRELQLQETPMPLQHMVDLLEPEFDFVEHLDNYDVYRRK